MADDGCIAMRGGEFRHSLIDEDGYCAYCGAQDEPSPDTAADRSET